MHTSKLYCYGQRFSYLIIYAEIKKLISDYKEGKIMCTCRP